MDHCRMFLCVGDCLALHFTKLTARLTETRAAWARHEDNIYVTGDVGAGFDGNTHYGGRDVFVLKTNSAGWILGL